MKKGLIKVIGIVLGTCLLTAGVFAFGDEQKTRGNRRGGHNQAQKLFMTVKVILHNQDKLKISDEQVKEITKIQTETQKTMIKNKADADIINVDLKTAFQKDDSDINEINRFIDAKYEKEKENAKLLAGAFVKVRAILNSEQKETLKNLIKENISKMKNRKNDRMPKGPRPQDNHQEYIN
jgi:Spy/CpxP family protein refolding chaperone